MRANLFMSVLILTAGAVMASAWAAEPVANRVCFARQQIEGFTAPNDHTVYLRVGGRDIYRLDLMNECPDLTFREAFGLEDRPSSPWICSALEATVVYHTNGIAQRCPVKAIHKLTPDEIATMPKRDKP